MMRNDGPAARNMAAVQCNRRIPAASKTCAYTKYDTLLTNSSKHANLVYGKQTMHEEIDITCDISAASEANRMVASSGAFFLSSLTATG